MEYMAIATHPLEGLVIEARVMDCLKELIICHSVVTHTHAITDQATTKDNKQLQPASMNRNIARNNIDISIKEVIGNVFWMLNHN